MKNGYGRKSKSFFPGGLPMGEGRDRAGTEAYGLKKRGKTVSRAKTITEGLEKQVMPFKEFCHEPMNPLDAASGRDQGAPVTVPEYAQLRLGRRGQVGASLGGVRASQQALLAATVLPEGVFEEVEERMENMDDDMQGLGLVAVEPVLVFA